ncbi:MAG: hypothetical protein WC607_03585 [Candidatus Micrarchaeia archaeon]
MTKHGSRVQMAKRMPHSKMLHGQMAMWMLTKFAMVFFIMALAGLLLSFSEREREGLCNTQALRVANGIGGSIAQVVNSPLEDERKVYPLESVLSTGKEDYERYEITVTHRAPDGEHSLRVEVTAVQQGCSAAKNVPFTGYDGQTPVGFRVYLLGGAVVDHAFTLEPSNPDARSRYFVMVKCQSKEYPFTRHLFLQDCKNENPTDCLPLSEGEIDACCGWPAGGAVCPMASADGGLE